MKKGIILILAIILIVGNLADISKYSASINFYGEKTDVYLGEDILLKLSIVNLVSNPKMTAQVIILPSSGMSVTSAEFTQVSAGQFAANYELNPGDGRDIEIKLRSNQVGEFNIKGRVVYYFGNDSGNTQDYVLDLPVKVRKETVLSTSKNYHQEGSISSEILVIAIGMIAFIILFSVLLVYILKRK